MPSATLATSLSQKMCGNHLSPFLHFSLSASMQCSFSKCFRQAGIVAARFAATRGARTGSASETEDGAGAVNFMAGGGERG